MNEQQLWCSLILAASFVANAAPGQAVQGQRGAHPRANARVAGVNPGPASSQAGKAWRVEGQVGRTLESSEFVNPLSILVRLAPGVAPGLRSAQVGECRIGGQRIAVAVGRQSDRSRNLALVIDATDSGSLENGTTLAMETHQSVRPSPIQSADPVTFDLKIGKNTIPAVASYLGPRIPGRSGLLTIFLPLHWSAWTKVGDARAALAVIDHDLDGTLGTGGDLWSAHSGRQRVHSLAMRPLTEAFFLHGHLVRLKLDGTSGRVHAEPAAGPDPVTCAAHRERVRRHWLDQLVATRPHLRTEARSEPIQWQLLTFDQARAKAKTSAKPLFVDIRELHSELSYWLDADIYCNPEVSRLINERFVPIQIIREQDFGDDFHRLLQGALGETRAPSTSVFDAAGELVLKVPHQPRPEMFANRLRAALEQTRAPRDR